MKKEGGIRKRESAVAIILIFAVLVIISWRMLERDVLFSGDGTWEYDADSSNVYGSYSGNANVRGIVNMSFSEQKNVEFTSDFNGGINLISLFEEMGYEGGKNFTCSPASCKKGYSVLGGGTSSKQISLVEGEKQKFGFVLSTSSNVKAKVKEFEMEIDAGEAVSCVNQVYIDLFDDGVVDFYNVLPGEGACGTKDYGCFNGGEEERTIGDAPFCEKIKLSAAPAYKVGAEIISGGSGTDDLAMNVYNLSGTLLGSCKLSSNVLIDGESGEIDCIVEYSSDEDFDAFVCISKSGDINHKIKVEFEEPCGFNEKMPAGIGKELTTDYEIFAQSMQYAGLKDFKFPEDYDGFKEGVVERMLNDYLEKMYGSDCREDCVIPFSVWSEKASQSVLLDNVYIQYSATGGDTDTNKVWEIEEEDFTIDSGFLNLDIEKMNFVVPNVDGNVSFILKFGGEKILEKSLRVNKVFDFDIGPKFVLIGQNTLFSAQTSENISSSIWNFGDGTQETHYGKEATHRYMNSNEYWVEVTLTNSAGRMSTKKFKIIVGEPKNSAKILIQDYKSRISNLDGQLNNFSLFAKEAIKTKILLEESRSLLAKIDEDFKLLGNDSSDSEYIAIIGKLINLYIPSSVEVGFKGNVLGEVGFNNINVDYIEEISDESGGGDDLLRRRIIGWIDENYNMQIEFERFSVEEEVGKKILGGYYKIVLSKKAGASPDDSYLIIGFPERGIKFKTNYEQRSFMEDSAVYIPIEEDSAGKTVEFLILDENAPSVEMLGMYVSPVLDDLGVSGKMICDPDVDSNCKPGGFAWGRFLIGLGIVFIIVLIVYIFLQEWYKKYYERRLFKNPDELYNIINFIYNSRARGTKDEETKHKLIEMKWKKEKVRYAFRKIDGKRTGMWEIPIFKSFENKRIKKEIQKKNPGGEFNQGLVLRRNAPFVGSRMV